MDRPAGIAIVTGAAGGMGSATARALAADGWDNLLLCDRSAEALEAIAAPLRAAGAKVAVLTGDIADPAFPGQMIAAIGDQPIAAFVHTAGISPGMGDAARILVVNLDATVRLVDAVKPRMAQGGAAVLYASNSAHMPMPPEASAAFWAPLPEDGALALAHFAERPELAYPLSKIGVRALVKREAKSFGERGARLVSVSPGAIDTQMTRGESQSSPIVAHMINGSAIGRIGRPEELANVTAFLCSPKASFVSGVDWLVDGGQTAGMGF